MALFKKKGIITIPREAPTPNKVEPAPAVVAPVAAPIFISQTTEGVDLEEYELLSMDLGYKSINFERKKLALFLQREEIVVYKRHEVEKYLLKDVNEYVESGLYGRIFRDTSWDFPSYHSVQWMDISQYSKTVPVEALRMATRVRDGVECDLEFSVSEVVHNPDPFLAVNVKDDNEMFIIYKWDEPGFTVTPGKSE